MENIMTLRAIDLSLEIGQQILVGKSKKPAKITKIEFFEKSGEIVLGTTAGTRQALTFSLAQPKEEETMSPADKYR
jgi:hypothetical protein|tara:strand:+ start:1074 stop:1301 length:228 start_codon:yes stop_codon:yes gene_type:complete